MLAAARDDESRERAESTLTRGRDHVAVAEAALERASRGAAPSSSATRRRCRRRCRCSRSAPQRSPPRSSTCRRAPSGVRELVAWASHAHAELFVAPGQLDAQRERVIREANELATMLLGEPTYGSTVEQLAQRVLPLAGE